MTRAARSLAPILAFDVVGPLVTYYGLSAAGASALLALVLSGLLPAGGIALNAARGRGLDAIGAVVLIGIGVATAASLASGSAHVALLDGTLPTAVFGLLCLGSLWSTRPLMFRFAVEFIGPDTPRGRNFADRWRYAAFRRTFRVITIVWGLAFIAETAVLIVIVETASTDTAKTASNVLPLIVAATLTAWNFAYGQRVQRAAAAGRSAGRG